MSFVPPAGLCCGREQELGAWLLWELAHDMRDGARPPPDPSTVVVVLDGVVTRADVPGLCEHLRVLLEGSDADLVVCDVGALAHPDAATVDALARMQLTARRLGCSILFRDAGRELRALLRLMGLSDVVSLGAELGPGMRGEPEEREQLRGVEEEGHLADPTV